MMLLRQQMDESNHNMVNLLTQQIGIVFNHFIQNTNQSYQALSTQIGRIEDFFAPDDRSSYVILSMFFSYFQ